MIILPPQIKQTRKKTRILAPIRKPRSVELNYYNELNKIVKRLEEIGALYVTSSSSSQKIDDLDKEHQRIRRYVEVIAPIIALKLVTSVSVHSKARLERAIAQSLNVPIDEVRIVEESLATQFPRQLLSSPQKIETVIKDYLKIDDLPQLAAPEVQKSLPYLPADTEDLTVPLLERAGIMENVQLIKTIPERYFGDLVQAITANFYGRPQKNGAKDLKERIYQIGDISRRHAAFIARDQTAKLTANLTRLRQEAIGITKYRWRNAQDERVVGNPTGLYPKGTKGHGDHWHREGKIFAYSKPPEDGNPGVPYNCRCYAEGVLDLSNINTV